MPLLLMLSLLSVAPAQPFAITVVDAQTGRGVPLIELRTVNGIRYVTDSNGIVAFHEPGLMEQDVFFHVSGHGYEHAKDGFGFRGKALRVTSGSKATLKVTRLNIAERLYRVTGGGIYRDSLLMGAKVSLAEPALNAQVLGSDSVVNAVYRDRLYWFWGDTNRASYPLGNFEVPGAVSDLPNRGGLDPAEGVDLRYFLGDKGFAKPTARMPGSGPCWLTSLIPLKDQSGRERLYGAYVKIKAPMTVYNRGLMVFNDDKNEFEKLREIDLEAPMFATGHTMIQREDGVDYVAFCHPFPVVRVKATAEAFQEPASYEAYTCLKPGSRRGDPQLDRDDTGALRYAWRANTAPLGPADEAKLRNAGKITAAETRWHLIDRDSGKLVQPHGGTVTWNAHRKRWILVAVQTWGSSMLGEMWYAEADQALGPWTYGVKIVTHDRYSFYNPKQHPYFDQDGGRLIYFEGTYTHTFSGNNDPTPRYDYNQVMYRLDLSDPRLALPEPVYETSPGVLSRSRPEAGKARVAFFAPDRALPGTVSISLGALAIHAIHAGAKNPPAATVPLFEYRQTNGDGRKYSIDPAWKMPGYERVEEPVCRVWR
jgi:hypothetical protein